MIEASDKALKGELRLDIDAKRSKHYRYRLKTWIDALDHVIGENCARGYSVNSKLIELADELSHDLKLLNRLIERNQRK